MHSFKVMNQKIDVHSHTVDAAIAHGAPYG